MSLTQSSPDETLRPAPHGIFVPLLLISIAFLGSMVLETTMLVSDRKLLNESIAQQASAITSAGKIRSAAYSLATKMQSLADKGNSSALQIVDELKKRGVSINPNATISPPP